MIPVFVSSIQYPVYKKISTPDILVGMCQCGSIAKWLQFKLSYMITAGTDPEINQGGWLAYMFQVGSLIYVVIMSIIIAAIFKVGFYQSVSLAC